MSEWLEVIKNHAGYGEFKIENGKAFAQSVNLTIEHFNYLIQQAERVEVLGEVIDEIKRDEAELQSKYKTLYQENKRYKQALEEIRSEASSYTWSSAAFRLYDIANDALKEESQ